MWEEVELHAEALSRMKEEYIMKITHKDNHTITHKDYIVWTDAML